MTLLLQLLHVYNTHAYGFIKSNIQSDLLVYGAVGQEVVGVIGIGLTDPEPAIRMRKLPVLRVVNVVTTKIYVCPNCKLRLIRNC